MYKVLLMVFVGIAIASIGNQFAANPSILKLRDTTIHNARLIDTISEAMFGDYELETSYPLLYAVLLRFETSTMIGKFDTLNVLIFNLETYDRKFFTTNSNYSLFCTPRNKRIFFRSIIEFSESHPFLHCDSIMKIPE